MDWIIRTVNITYGDVGNWTRNIPFWYIFHVGIDPCMDNVHQISSFCQNMGLNHDGDVVDEVIALAVGTIENHGTSGKSKKGEHCKAMDWKSSENYTENIVNPGFYSRNMGLSCRSTCRLFSRTQGCWLSISKWAWSETRLPQNLRVHQCTNSSYIVT